MSVTLILMRHGEPEGGKKFRGHSIDDPLSEKGWAQMRSAITKPEQFDCIVTSPMKRCKDFADELAEQQQLDCHVIDDLKEIGFGHWEGKSRSIIKAMHAKEYAMFYADPEKHTPLDAEQLGVFYRRILGVVKQLKLDLDGQTVLLVAHAGVIRAILAQALETPMTMMYNMEVSNASQIKVIVGDNNKVYF